MDFFIELSTLLLLTLSVSIVMRLLKQPLIIGYIFAGILAGPHFLNLLKSPEIVEVFSKFGIEVLLFIVGLGLSPKVVKELGKVSLATGAGQVVATSVIGYFIGTALGYKSLEAAYISIALTFSSTIIILKLLSDKGDVNKLYGRIAVGFLLVQDLVATMLLVFVSAASSASGQANPAATVSLIFLKGIALLVLLFAISNYLLPKLESFLAGSQELLFIFSLAWGAGIGSLYYISGLSIEIGALVAGVCLSMTPYAGEVASRLKPLRDFFIVMFFLFLGSQMSGANWQNMIVPIIVFSLFILVGNPLIMLIVMNILGFSTRTGFLSGLLAAQISEFSLILIALAYKVGHISNEVVSMVTIVGVITISGSTYLILSGEKLYEYLKGHLKHFEIRKQRSEKDENPGRYDAILFGYHRVGRDFVDLFKRLNFEYLVIDFNPEAIRKLTESGIPNRYGDVEDIEFLDELPLNEVKLVVSTVPDYDANLLLVKRIRNANQATSVIVISKNIEDALDLYNSGASYVVMPHYLGAKFASQVISRNNINPNTMLQEREAHIEYLKKKLLVGQDGIEPSTSTL